MTRKSAFPTAYSVLLAWFSVSYCEFLKQTNPVFLQLSITESYKVYITFKPETYILLCESKLMAITHLLCNFTTIFFSIVIAKTLAQNFKTDILWFKCCSCIFKWIWNDGCIFNHYYPFVIFYPLVFLSIFWKK